MGIRNAPDSVLCTKPEVPIDREREKANQKKEKKEANENGRCSSSRK